jgi:hypothetical protein
MDMPNNMHKVNKKLPMNDSRNNKLWVRTESGNSCLGLGNQCNMAKPPIAKRSHASNNTGIAAVSGLDSAT